jgi:hypothetical protein
VNIEEILSRLERIDHKEYSGGFEFADSSTFNEMGRCFEERKILTKEIERLNSIIKEVRECINHYAIENEDYSKIYNDEEKELLGILDKENNNENN